jgi:hypothetical protein
VRNFWLENAESCCVRTFACGTAADRLQRCLRPAMCCWLGSIQEVLDQTRHRTAGGSQAALGRTARQDGSSWPSFCSELFCRQPEHIPGQRSRSRCTRPAPSGCVCCGRGYTAGGAGSAHGSQTTRCSQDSPAGSRVLPSRLTGAVGCAIFSKGMRFVEGAMLEVLC